MLFRYLHRIGRERFTYPIDVDENPPEARLWPWGDTRVPFKGMEPADETKGVPCGLFIPGYAQLGSRHYSNAILLNSDVLRKYGAKGRGRSEDLPWPTRPSTKRCGIPVKFSRPAGRMLYIVEYRTSQLMKITTSGRRGRHNRFAAALLMPARDVRKQIEKYPTPLDLRVHGEVLRSWYGVTISALKVRLRQLGVSFISN